MNEEIWVPLSPDEDGYLGRECPSCELYFKVLPGTGITNQEIAHCPYCQTADKPSNFLTADQLNYARSVALRQLRDEVLGELKQFPEIHTKGPISLHVTMQVEGADIPIEHYQERALETAITCEACTLQYKIYGVFATCPHCATHNSSTILRSNLDLLRKQLEDADDTRHEDILKNAVALFDAFGRATTEHHYGTKISFQSLDRADEQLQRQGAGLRTHTTREEWQFLIRAFQKRHLLTHSLGVIDDQYLQRANDPHAILGHKIHLDRNEVERTIDLLDRLAGTITVAAPPPPPLPPPSTRATNPYRLSTDALRLATLLFSLDTDGLAHYGRQERQAKEELGLGDLAFDAACSELADHRLVDTEQGWLRSTHQMPLALPDEIDYSPTRDDEQVARAAVDANKPIPNAELATIVGLPVDRVNRAVKRLDDKQALAVRTAIGSAPYAFTDIRATGATLRYLRNF